MIDDASIPRLTCLDCGCVVDDNGAPWVPCAAIRDTYGALTELLHGTWLSVDDTARDIEAALWTIATHVADSRAAMAQGADARQAVML